MADGSNPPDWSGSGRTRPGGWWRCTWTRRLCGWAGSAGSTAEAAEAAISFAQRTRQWLDSTGDACTKVAHLVLDRPSRSR